MKIKAKLLNCGSCVTCCQLDKIYLHTDEGDDPSKYHTTILDHRLALKHKENGDCIYLDRKSGCTIYEDRPVICRTLDCRKVYKLVKRRPYLLTKGYIDERFMNAAKRAIKRNR